MWHHPKYYKELRKRNKLDRVISESSRDGESERAPGPGLKPQAPSDSNSRPQASSDKQQASSVKPQAPEASSDKHQAPSSKRQA